MNHCENKFWPIFQRIMGTGKSTNACSTDDVEAWDSLRHIELVFELEEAFSLNIDPDDITSLYSNTETVLAYLTSQMAANNE